MAELQNAVLQVQTYLRALSGVRIAPDYPPDSAGVFPFAICYPGTGTMEFGPAGERKGLHNLVIEIHLERADLPRSVEKAIPFGDTIPNLLINKLLNDNKWNRTIDTFRSVSYVFGPMTYAGVDTVGWRFTVNDVKILSAVT